MLPYKKYIISLFFLGKDVKKIIDSISMHDFNIEKKDVVDIIDEYKALFSETINKLLNLGNRLDPENESVIPWLKYFKIEDFYNFMYHNGCNPEFTPLYYKWCNDALWILEHEDVRNMVNIFLFNKEPYESIGKIVKFKYRKKISKKAFTLYENIFWDTSTLTAKDVLSIYKPFQDTTLVIRRLENGYSKDTCIIEKTSKTFDITKNILDQDINWVKWKIGYQNIEAPTPENFLKKVQRDASMMYDEIMQINSVKEFKVIENKEVTSFDEDGKMKKDLVDEVETHIKNPIDFKAKHMKGFTELFIKAQEHMPKDGSTSTEKFFERLNKIEMSYTSEFDAKLVSIEDNSEVMNDILEAKGGGEDDDGF